MSLNLFDKSLYVDPYEMFKKWRNESPVVFDAENNTYGLTKYDDIQLAFKSPDIFTSSRGARANAIPQPFMIDADDPSHRVQRRVVERSFTPGQMAFHSKEIEDIAFKLISLASNNNEFDIVEKVFHQLPSISIGKILGVPESDYGLLQKWGQAMVEGADGWENVTDEVISAVLDWYEYFDNLAKYKLRHKDGSLICQLLSAHYDDNEISFEQVAGNALALLVGGNETARYFISNSFYKLLKDRINFESLVGDKNLIESAVEECLRFCGPVISSVRHTTEDVYISGYKLKQDSQVMLFIPSANMDEKIFNEPEKFDITRKQNKHIGFGFGIHYCLGASLARIQLKVVIEQITKVCPGIKIKDDFHPDWKYSTFLRGIKNLEVII